MDKKWYFVPNLYSDEDGLNDAGIETFSADAEKSMIREVIQNAIDQHVGPETEPVKVVFGASVPSGAVISRVGSRLFISTVSSVVFARSMRTVRTSFL